MLQNQFGRRLPASNRRWREQQQFITWGTIGGAILAFFIGSAIAVVKYDGAPKLSVKHSEPATIGQRIPSTDPLAPASIAAPNPRE
jgi:hypothetical protein